MIGVGIEGVVMLMSAALSAGILPGIQRRVLERLKARVDP